MSFGDSSSSPSSTTITRVTTPTQGVTDAMCGGTFGEPTLTFVGGLGSNRVMVSTDGETFTNVPTKGPGLRSILRDGDVTWLCGEYGALFKAAPDLGTLESVPLNVQACLHGLARTSDGAIWVAGDGGFLVRSRNGGPFEPVAGIAGTIRKMMSTALGLLLPSKKGLFIVREGADPEKLGTGDVNHVAVTRAQTLIVVGNKNTIRRSTNGGRTFKAAAVPEFVATVVPAEERLPRASWIGESQDLNVVAETADGRIVVGGDGGVVLVSSDDGATFERVEHQLCGGSLWGIGTWNGTVFLAGENSIVLRVG